MAGLLRYSVRAAGVLSLALMLGGVAGAQTSDALSRTIESKVRPGDHVILNFMRDRELNSDVTVDERGNAAFPKIGVVHVTAMTIGALQDTLRARYAEFLRVPDFEVAVLRRVTVNGEVRIPNVYMVDGASTVRDVIARAGGVLETGNRNNVTIIRDGERVSVRGWDRSDGDRFDLQSGDQVVVGRKSWLAMNFLSVISTAVLVSSFVISQLP